MAYLKALLVAVVCAVAMFFLIRVVTWLDSLFTVRTALFFTARHYFSYVAAVIVGIAMFIHTLGSSRRYWE